jgi:crotonobetainyl-CoA:carnitine CoA-transferase CaiB-like acyl-CoA transferase
MSALQGVKILDLTRLGPGPFCTMILADLGAEVIGVEAPLKITGKAAGLGRSSASQEERRWVAYSALDRNKKSVALNLKSEKGRDIFHNLAKKADIIVEGFRPGVAKRLGIDYETISKVNSRIIYCSITGYGQNGPYRDLIGRDINYISFAGALNLIGEKSGPPIIPLNLLADFGGGGMSAVTGILAALIARSKTDKGQYIDISLTDTVLSLLSAMAGYHFQFG